MDFPRPAGDELFCPGIDVAFAEGGGIERVEDGLRVRHVDFDECAVGRESFSRRHTEGYPARGCLGRGRRGALLGGPFKRLKHREPNQLHSRRDKHPIGTEALARGQVGRAHARFGMENRVRLIYGIGAKRPHDLT